MKKKMCLIADARSIHTERWYNYFKEKGWDLTLISVYPGRVSGSDVISLKQKEVLFKPLSHLLTAGKIKKIIQKINPDVVFALYLYPYGFFASKCKGYKKAVSVIGSDILVTPKRYPKQMVSSLLRKFDYIHCHGKFIEREVLKYSPPKDVLSSEVWGVNLRKYRKQKNLDWLRKKIGVKKSDLVVVDQRAFEEVYGIDVLIDAVGIVSKEIKNVKLVLAGKGEMKEQLEEYAKKKGLSEHVIFPEGGVKTDEVPSYLSISDVYVQAPRSDAIAIALMEAMATPLACVSTDIGGTKDYLINGKGGYLVSKDDSKKMAAYLIKLLKSKQLRDKMAKYNFDVAYKEFDQFRNMDAINERLMLLVT